MKYRYRIFFYFINLVFYYIGTIHNQKFQSLEQIKNVSKTLTQIYLLLRLSIPRRKDSLFDKKKEKKNLIKIADRKQRCKNF